MKKTIYELFDFILMISVYVGFAMCWIICLIYALGIDLF